MRERGLGLVLSSVVVRAGCVVDVHLVTIASSLGQLLCWCIFKSVIVLS